MYMAQNWANNSMLTKCSPSPTNLHAYRRHVPCLPFRGSFTTSKNNKSMHHSKITTIFMFKNISNTNIQEQHQCIKKWQQHQCVQITPTCLNNTIAFKQHQCVKKQQHHHSKRTTTFAFQNINNTDNQEQWQQ